MTWLDRALLFSPLDYASVAGLVLAWAVMGWIIENASPQRPSTTRLMSNYRRAWMTEMITRSPRIFDAQIVASLRQGTSFFASTALIALGGVFAAIGNAESFTNVASDLLQTETPLFVWEVKMLLVGVFLLNAFLKFVWSNRLFGYASVLMGAVPNDITDPTCAAKAAQAAEMNVLASKSFNRGLRATYFALAATAWLLGPYALIGATLLTLGIIWRREYASRARKVLMNT